MRLIRTAAVVAVIEGAYAGLRWVGVLPSTIPTQRNARRYP